MSYEFGVRRRTHNAKRRTNMIQTLKRQIRIFKNYGHLVRAVFANIFYGYPSKKLKVIGVTGTDGKTTTTHLIYHILSSAGKKVSMLSTVTSPGLHWTTPNPLKVQKILKQVVQKGDQYFVLETTSHALDQNRVHGIDFYVSVLTNISHEHLDYHITYKNYLKAKSKLFLHSKTSLINADDKSFEPMKKILEKNNKKFVTYGLNNKAEFNFDYKKKFDDNLPGYNNYNYLAAYGVAKLLDIPENKIIDALKTFVLPQGRYNVVYDKEFKVIIDFAHTPNGLASLLTDLKERTERTQGKIIHVFGAAGKRDRSKRPLMGEESGRFADIVILTEEDYRNEDPAEICRQIAEGLISQDFSKEDPKGLTNSNGKKFAIILNREEAIKKALEIAEKGDIVILTGKGHEKSLARGRKEYPWNEKETVGKFLNKKL